MPVIWPANLEHRSLPKPALTDRLWRYMDFTKFLAMLVNKGLYISRLDKLDDAYEGWIPRPQKEHYSGFFGKQYIDRDRDLRKQWLGLRKLFYVNCWHANDEQSDAMWKLYARKGDGIAIRTTSRSLQKSLKNAPEELGLYKVIYADSKKRPVHGGSMLRACMTKRMPFEHEKEVRVVWYNEQTVKNRREKREPKEGFHVNCDLVELIEQIYIAPDTGRWFERVVKDVLEKYRITVRVERSNLNSEPP